MSACPPACPFSLECGLPRQNDPCLGPKIVSHFEDLLCAQHSGVSRLLVTQPESQWLPRALLQPGRSTEYTGQVRLWSGARVLVASPRLSGAGPAQEGDKQRSPVSQEPPA